MDEPAPGTTDWNLLELGRTLRGSAEWGTKRVSRVLLNTPELRLVLVAMPAGVRWPEHQASGRLSVLTLEGAIVFAVPDGPRTLRAGGLLSIAAGTAHDVEALEDSLFLLTVTSALASTPPM